jgi:hypothetical protein
MDREHTIRLKLSEAPTAILQRELAHAEEAARRCERQGSTWHTWGGRAEAIRDALDARRRAVLSTEQKEERRGS